MSDRLRIIFIAITSIFIGINPAFAQLIPDRTLGSESSTVVPVNANRNDIGGGARRGSNLFHSFREFNVNSERAVYFNNPAGVENIINRVTGRNTSNIFGTLGVYGNANLYLINPNGIVFGDGAFLDINGTFIGTTADGIKLGVNDVYSASNPPSSSLLTIKPGTLFVDRIKTVKSSIVNRGNLEVKPGANLILSGDIVENNNSINLPGGNIFIEAVNGNISTSNIDVSSTSGNGGNITLKSSNNIIINNGAEILSTGRLGGNINIESSAKLTANNALIRSSSTGNIIEKGGTIRVLVGDSIEFNNSFLNANTQGAADTGDIIINANSIRLNNGSRIAAGTFGPGRGGNLIISAKTIEAIGINREANILSGIFADSFNSGNAGNLSIETDTLRVTDGAVITAASFGTGKGGNLTVTANNIELIGVGLIDRFSSSGLFAPSIRGEGNAGELTINTNSLRVLNGAQISVGTFERGNGGNLSIKARSLELNGTDPVSGFSSGLFSSAIDFFSENTASRGGNIIVVTEQLKILNGALIDSSNFPPSGSLGKAGLGRTGDINITAAEIVLDRGKITASGNIRGGGGININSSNFLLLKNQSEISTDVNETIGFTGGNININTPIVIANPDFNQITAKAVTSAGGNITIDTGTILGYPQFLTIDASSSLGIDGNVNINAIADEINKVSLDISSTSALDAAAILANDICLASDDRSGKVSSFTIPGKGGIISSPLEAVERSRGIVKWSKYPEAKTKIRSTHRNRSIATISSPKKFQPAVGWYRQRDGTVVLTANPAEVKPLNEPVNYSCTLK